jgi:hypothetical protein
VGRGPQNGRAPHLFALLLFAGVVAIVWWLLAMGERLLPEFARLLDRPVLHRGSLSVFFGLSSVTGAFRGREVAVTLQLKRGRYTQGSLIIAMRVGGEQTLTYDGIEARTRDDTGRRALFTSAANDILLNVEDGWLKALWQPTGFVIFPGSFEEQKWRTVLDAMSVIAASLESAT